jgi:hypothetical protein
MELKAESADLEIPRMRCAPFHASLGVDPAGTAGAYDVFMCVEVPLPWDRDISSSEPFLSLFGAGAASGLMADGRSVRPQGLVPRPGAEGWRRVLVFERPSRSEQVTGGPYRRREWWVQPEEVLDLCRALLGADSESLGVFEDRRVVVAPDVIDLFVCTHGKRDACCGSTGAALRDLLAERLAGLDPDEQQVRLWRVSHTGGHRFAPTALTFPDGYAWAHLDVDRSLALALRSVEPAELGRNCRGSASLVGSPAQAADRAALVEVGWEWAGAERRVTVTGFDRRSLATDVRVEGDLPGGRQVGFDVRVEVEGHVPQITCGGIDTPEYTVEPVWHVASVVAL